MKISIIVAHDLNGVIGKDNKLPWNLPTDLKRFKEITSGHCILMGSKTFDSIGKPLPNRTNIILTSQPEKYEGLEGVICFRSIESAVAHALHQNETELFIIGGGSIYKQALEQKIVDRVYLTLVLTEVENGDTIFPDISAPSYGFENKFPPDMHKDPKDQFKYLTYIWERNA